MSLLTDHLRDVGQKLREQSMTPRERVLSVLNGEMPDRVPFTCYDSLLPRGELEVGLRTDGLALLMHCPVFATERPHVEVDRRDYYENGRLFIRETFRTPVGEVWQTKRTGGGYGTSRLTEYLIAQPRDYKVVEFMVRDEVYTPTYDQFLVATDVLGEAGLVMGGWLPRSPLMCMLWELMGPERCAIDMHERPDDFFRLYDTLAQQRREQYEIATASPALVLHVGDNITSDMIGPDRFVRYCVPCYNEFASYLHSEGKLLAVHMDGRMKAIADAVADSQVDIIEAFSAVPDGDLELAEAHRAWPDKIIWTNYPSPVHLWPPEQILSYTRQMLRDIAPGDRFIVGITENIPEAVWQTSLPIISRVLAEEGSLPLFPS